MMPLYGRISRALPLTIFEQPEKDEFSLFGRAVRRNTFVYCITRRIAQIAFSFLYRIEIERETIPPSQNLAIILPKHQYWTDIPLVSLCFHDPLHFVAKKELFRAPGIRSYLSLVGGIPLDRERSIRTLNSFKYLISRLKADEKVVIFPEGTYVRGAVGSGKSRLIQMILQFQSELKDPIPFIPVGIRYGGRVGWRRRVEIRIGPPLFGDGGSDGLSLTRRAMEEISRLCGLPRAGGEFEMKQGQKCGS
jgi:1-acyl-sn-glycerol-3-phosphate acyltransferase